MSRNCPLHPDSEHTVQQQDTLCIRIVDSHVFRFLFGFEKFVDVLSPLSSDKHMKSFPCIAILTSSFELRNKDALCVASSESS